MQSARIPPYISTIGNNLKPSNFLPRIFNMRNNCGGICDVRIFKPASREI